MQKKKDTMSIATTTQGFKPLKKTFYLALDISAHGDGEHGDSGMKAEAYDQHSLISFALNSQRPGNKRTIRCSSKFRLEESR